MRFLIAPQAFKGSLSSSGVAAAIVTGLRRVFADADFTLLPLADGGEGTVQALIEATGGKPYSATVSGPLGDRLDANWGLLGDRCTAVIEMAAASALPLVPPNRLNPLLASTYGTGELIRSALDAGCRDFIIGIGGSATNDAGAGMAQALGVRLLNDAGEDLPRGGAGSVALSTNRCGRSGPPCPREPLSRRL